MSVRSQTIQQPLARLVLSAIYRRTATSAAILMSERAPRRTAGRILQPLATNRLLCVSATFGENFNSSHGLVYTDDSDLFRLQSTLRLIVDDAQK